MKKSSRTSMTKPKKKNRKAAKDASFQASTSGGREGGVQRDLLETCDRMEAQARKERMVRKSALGGKMWQGSSKVQ